MTPEHVIGRVLTTFSVGSMASAMAGMTGFGWGADAIGHAASLAGLGLVLVLTAAVAVACGHKACILLRASMNESAPHDRAALRLSLLREGGSPAMATGRTFCATILIAIALRGLLASHKRLY